MNTIFHYISEMIPYIFLALPVILLFRYVYNKIRRNRKTTIYHEIGVISFLLFLTALFSQTIITSLYTGPVVNQLFTAINLTPFRVFQDTYYAITVNNHWQPFIINFLGNICIFIPIGFLVPLLWRSFEHFWKVSLLGLCISFFIETIQLTQLRSTDIDDLWLNTLGSIIGYLLFKLIKNKFPNVVIRFKVNDDV